MPIMYSTCYNESGTVFVFVLKKYFFFHLIWLIFIEANNLTDGGSKPVSDGVFLRFSN